MSTTLNEATRKVIAQAIQRANVEITYHDAQAREAEADARDHRETIKHLTQYREDLAANLDGGIVAAPDIASDERISTVNTRPGS